MDPSGPCLKRYDMRMNGKRGKCKYKWQSRAIQEFCYPLFSFSVRKFEHGTITERNFPVVHTNKIGTLRFLIGTL